VAGTTVVAEDRGSDPRTAAVCYQQFLLSVDSYDPSQHHEFRNLIEGGLRLEIKYESIYGGEGFTVVYPRHG
jgi:hypothetical protein